MLHITKSINRFKYTIILSFTLILQIVTGATSNQLGGELNYIVSNSIKDLMVQYEYHPELALIMDSIQIKVIFKLSYSLICDGFRDSVFSIKLERL